MQIFNGKIVVDKAEGETASTMSGATGMTGAQSKAASNKAMLVQQTA